MFYIRNIVGASSSGAGKSHCRTRSCHGQNISRAVPKSAEDALRFEMDDVERAVDKVEGWLTKDEGRLLYKVAKKCSTKGAIVEIGSWKGKSTIWIAKGSKAGKHARVYAVDPHIGSSEHKKMFGTVATFQDFQRNIKETQVDDIVAPIVKTSKDAAADFVEPIEFIFIDGAHEYEFVKEDFDLWFPKVVTGGVVAFHDIGWPGPKRVFREELCQSRRFKRVGFIDSVGYGVKTPPNSLADRVRNFGILCLSFSFEVKQRVRIPEPFKRWLRPVLRIATSTISKIA